jgi:hypothetical protein
MAIVVVLDEPDLLGLGRTARDRSRVVTDNLGTAAPSLGRS